jgi:23S rRNA (pseudouridine1915-N3)-methyltransferase
MKIKLIVVGKTEDAYLEEGIEKYMKRIGHYIAFELMYLPDVKSGSKMSSDKLKEEEGKQILSKIQPNDYVILMDERGSIFSSVEFSKFLQKKMNASTSNLIFVIGGAFGFSNDVYQRAQETMALSKMTFSHQMVRLFFIEQVYRAFTIIKGEKYHHF